MREILFRGIRKDTHEWVYGFYVEYFDGKRNVPCISVVDTHVITGALCYEVIPETVGQYTGLKDKNGRQIFEGDILKEKQSNQALIFTVDWCEDCAMFVTPCKNFKSLEFDFTTSYGEQFEIIGNIHDSAELLS